MSDKEEIVEKLRRMFKNISKAEGVSVGTVPFEGEESPAVVLHVASDKVAKQLGKDFADIIESIVDVGDDEEGGKK